jgi:hypothetical protein
MNRLAGPAPLREVKAITLSVSLAPAILEVLA